MEWLDGWMDGWMDGLFMVGKMRIPEGVVDRRSEQ